MQIKISITDYKPKKEWSVLAVSGVIVLDDFQEGLYIPLDWWSIEDYERQWKEGLVRLEDHDQSCLVATINDHQKDLILTGGCFIKLVIRYIFKTICL